MNIIKGKEKFWSALLAGGFVSSISVLALYIASMSGAVDTPDKEMIAGAITGIIVALASAFGAYIATNSTPTNISVPAEAVGEPVVNLSPEATAPVAVQPVAIKPPRADEV